MRSLGRVELDVVDHEKVEKAVAVEIEEGAAGAPARLRRGKATAFSFIVKGAVALVVVENVASPLGDEDVVVAVVIDVACADALSPAGVREASFLCDVFKLEPAEVAIKNGFGAAGPD